VTPNEFDIPVDKQRVYAVMEQVSQTRPLKGGKLPEETKNLYSTPLTTSFKAAREKADQLIARREGEQKA
jgi:hypothetical protein